MISRLLGQEQEHSQHSADSVPDAMVEEEDDRSQGGFGLGAFRFNL